MIKLRTDLKKVQILTEGFEEEAHYIERSGNLFIYTYLNAHGQGTLHQLRSIDEVKTFMEELYVGYVDYWQNEGRTILVNVEEDFKSLKDALNV
jgi:hypothetical protein